MRSLAQALLAVALVGGARAQPGQTELRFAHLTADDGLSRNWVRTTVRDRRGFLWIGTRSGLNRYDGRRFTTYRHTPDRPGSLPSSIVWSVYEDRRGRLWVGTASGSDSAAAEGEPGGLALYDRENDLFVRIPSGPGKGGLADTFVKVITEDRGGRLWVGTRVGLESVSLEDGDVSVQSYALPVGSVPLRLVNAILEDSAGDLWVGSEAGLHRFSVREARFVPWARSEGDRLLAGADVQDLTLGEDGVLWVATAGLGLFLLDPERGVLAHHVPRPGDPSSLGHLRIRCLARDAQGRVWVGTENGGLSVLDPDTGSFTRHVPGIGDEGLNSASIWSIDIDREGIVWLGTYNGGVNYIAPFTKRFELFAARPDGLSNRHVNAVMEARDGDLWIATDGGGVNRVDGLTGEYTHYRHDPTDPTSIASDSICAILEDEEGSIWLGGWEASLSRLDPDTGRVEGFSAGESPTIFDSVWHLLELRTGQLLVATHGGVQLFDRETHTFTPLWSLYPGAGRETVFTAAEDPDGGIWLGLKDGGGVQHIDPDTGAVTEYAHDPADPTSLGEGAVMDSLVDSRGNVWFGTEGGLSCFGGGTEALRRYTTADGLPHSAVAGILEDASGDLWLSTHGGLTRFLDGILVPAEPTFVNFDRHDGLQGNEFRAGAAFGSDSGRLYFGGHGGLNSFLPEEIQLNPVPPPVVFTDLRIFNRSVRPGAPGSPLEIALTEATDLRLSHEHSVVTFEFAALNYILPEKNRYRYQLEGVDPDWIDAGTRTTATYTKLPPGRYALRVTASNNDGVWNETGARLSVVVSPPYWQTWWFRVGGLLGMSALLWAGHLSRTRAIRSRNAALQAEIERRRRVEGILEETNARLETSNAELERLARHDPLTGLSNRRDFVEIADREILRARRTKRPFALLLADLDHFKSVNDLHGHACGDAVLVEVARKLVALVRRQDTVARWGGEEFMMLFPETREDESLQLAERIREGIASASFAFDGIRLSLTLTVGITAHRAGESFDAMSARIDRALYEGKGGGRNRVVPA